MCGRSSPSPHRLLYAIGPGKLTLLEEVWGEPRTPTCLGDISARGGTEHFSPALQGAMGLLLVRGEPQ